jgi:hypothetical protein
MVTDNFGSVVPSGVPVTAKLKIGQVSKSGVLSRTTTTDSDGKFIVSGLEPGTYELTAEFFGMAFKDDNVVVIGSETKELEVRLTYEGNCFVNSGSAALTVPDSDRAEIVNQILVDALVRNRIPDYSLLVNQKGPIIISTEGIDAAWIKPVSNFKFGYLSRAEIQNKADRGKDFLYLSFHDWKIETNCIAVTLANGWAVGKHSNMGYISGGGLIYLFRKESDKWIGKTVGGWIS